MIFGHAVRVAGGINRSADIGRAWQKIAPRIHAPQNLGNGHARDAVFIRITGDNFPALVVAGPERDARMTAQFFDNRFDLVRDFPLKFLILRIGRAAHGEVLPDQNAVTVAEVEKCVILVHTAAPAAHHVAVGFPQKRKRLIQPLGVAGMEGV